MKRKILVALLLMASAAVWFGCGKDEESAESTGSIYGTVTDLANGEPVSNVNVKLKPSGEATLTGSDGTYEFKDIKAGKYTLSFSKAEYADFDDDNVIELEAGRTAKRDVQIQKQMAVLRITDMEGNPIPSLDFGMDEAVTSKSFNIFNNGTKTINCHLSYNCVWIDTVIIMGTEIIPGQTKTVTVIIDRLQLSSAENRTYMHIISDNGSNELLITATGYGAPIVTTNSVSAITATSATCGGNVTSDGGNAVTNRGLCWATTNAPTLENGNHLSLGTGIGTFSGTLSGLALNTVYYVRAYATNARGTSYGEEKQFTTNNGQPTVKIDAVSNITATSATCGGSISSNGGVAITDKGLVWSTAQYPTITDNKLSLGSGEAPFTGSISNLSIGTVYYVRAYATNANGTAYSSEQKKFTTANGLPTVTTTAATINKNVIVSGGNVTNDGGYAITARGICYGILPNPDLSNIYSHTEDGTGIGYFTSTIPNSNENIYIRAYATNANGTTYGKQVIYESEYVDLGLTSGTKWKKSDVNGEYTYDEAVRTFGNKLPSKTQWNELRSQCQWSWTGSGYEVIGPNGNSIFLAGFSNNYSYYWSSTSNGSGSDEAWCLRFDRYGTTMDTYSRKWECSVRLVVN